MPEEPAGARVFAHHVEVALRRAASVGRQLQHEPAGESSPLELGVRADAADLAERILRACARRPWRAAAHRRRFRTACSARWSGDRTGPLAWRVPRPASRAADRGGTLGRLVVAGAAALQTILNMSRSRVDPPARRRRIRRALAVEVLAGLAESRQHREIVPLGIREADDRREALRVAAHAAFALVANCACGPASVCQVMLLSRCSIARQRDGGGAPSRPGGSASGAPVTACGRGYGTCRRGRREGEAPECSPQVLTTPLPGGERWHRQLVHDALDDVVPAAVPSRRATRTSRRPGSSPTSSRGTTGMLRPDGQAATGSGCKHSEVREVGWSGQAIVATVDVGDRDAGQLFVRHVFEAARG